MTHWMSSFKCHWVHLNPISGLEDIIELPDVARAERETECAEELNSALLE